MLGALKTVLANLPVENLLMKSPVGNHYTSPSQNSSGMLRRNCVIKISFTLIITTDLFYTLLQPGTMMN